MNEKKELKFEGIDHFNRPVFKDQQNYRYGSVCSLFSFDATYEEVIKKITVFHLCYFGTHFGCEPHGGMIEPNNFKIVKEFTKPKE
jgi:hypothetical protein